MCMSEHRGPCHWQVLGPPSGASLYVCDGRHCNHKHEGGYVAMETPKLLPAEEMRRLFGIEA